MAATGSFGIFSFHVDAKEEEERGRGWSSRQQVSCAHTGNEPRHEANLPSTGLPVYSLCIVAYRGPRSTRH